jgi:hypothetical protein
MNAVIFLQNKKFESYACIMRMVLHDPERIKKYLIASLAGLGAVLSNALKTVSQVRSGQAGNIARAEERSVKNDAASYVCRGIFSFSLPLRYGFRQMSGA